MERMDTVAPPCRRFGCASIGIALCALFLWAAPANALVISEPGSPTIATASAAASLRAAETAVVGRINRVRTEYGLQPLRVAIPLTRSARKHSLDMGLRDYLSHTTRGAGTSFLRRIQREEGRARSSYYGETIGYLTTQADVADGIVRAWLASPPHRKILLDERFRRIGVGAWRGTFSGQPGATVFTANVAG
jgi:uncharacterized protein YkwD